MFSVKEAGSGQFRMPNGLTVYGLGKNDTINVYRDIFESDCYLQHGITVRDGDCIFDVGANTGLFLLYLNTVLKRTRIFAFEPIPDIYRVLKRNVLACDRLSVATYNVGLSNTSGQAAFTFYPRFSNASTMHPDESREIVRQGREYVINQANTLMWPLPTLVSWLPDWAKNVIAEPIRRHFMSKKLVRCELITLSDFIRKNNIERIDLLKIDAERSERAILDGIRTEDWEKIRQVIVEIHGGKDELITVQALLQQHGFRTEFEPNPTMPDLFLLYALR